MSRNRRRSDRELLRAVATARELLDLTLAFGKEHYSDFNWQRLLDAVETLSRFEAELRAQLPKEAPPQPVATPMERREPVDPMTAAMNAMIRQAHKAPE